MRFSGIVIFTIKPDGVTEASEDEANLKTVYMKNAGHVLLMVDSSKLGQQYFCRISGLDRVWKLLTDIPLPPEYDAHLSAD